MKSLTHIALLTLTNINWTSNSTSPRMQSLADRLQELEAKHAVTVRRLEAVIRMLLLHVHDHPWMSHCRAPMLHDTIQIRELLVDITTHVDGLPALHPEHPCGGCYLKAEMRNCLPKWGVCLIVNAEYQVIRANSLVLRFHLWHAPIRKDTFCVIILSVMHALLGIGTS